MTIVLAAISSANTIRERVTLLSVALRRLRLLSAWILGEMYG